jgi:hypothetical protein
MKPCPIPTEAPTRACHNCRRSRRKCDRSVPTCTKCYSTGQACLGYGELLLWTNSVASRGKMMGKTYAVTGTPKTQLNAPLINSASLATRSKAISSYRGENTLFHDPTQNWCWQLGNPFFQDMSSSSKFYLSYCKYAPYM